MEIGTRARTQPPPPHIVFDALARPVRSGPREWLALHADEVEPTVLDAAPPNTLTWSSLWPERPDAVVRFDIAPDAGDGTLLRWTLSVAEPAPDDALVGHLRHRLNRLINRDLRFSFGQ